MFFQNVFDQEFNQRLFSLSYKVSASQKRVRNLIASSTPGPFNLNSSSQRTLTIYYAYDKNFKNYASVAVNIVGATPAATTTQEIIAILNANATFRDRFEAYAQNDYVLIKINNNQNSQNGIELRFYVENTGAEQKLKFNRYAGVNEMPSYFARHTIANRRVFNDSANLLQPLSHTITSASVANPSVVTSTAHGLTSGDSILIENSNTTPTIDGARIVTVTGADTFTVPVNVTVAGTRGDWMSVYEQELITDAGFTAADIKTDWELLGGVPNLFSGVSNLFAFQKNTVDSSSRITECIEYHAGAVVGDRVGHPGDAGFQVPKLVLIKLLKFLMY